MAKKESKSSFDREYTIPLRKGFRKIANYKKTPRAVREVVKFLERHTKVKEIKLGMHLNEHLWQNGKKNPPAKVKVQVSVKDGVAMAELFGKTFKGAVKANKKEEPKNLKEKIEDKLGGAPKHEPKAEEKPAEAAAPHHEEKAAEHKPAEKKAPVKKKASPKAETA